MKATSHDIHCGRCHMWHRRKECPTHDRLRVNVYTHKVSGQYLGKVCLEGERRPMYTTEGYTTSIRAYRAAEEWVEAQRYEIVAGRA